MIMKCFIGSSMGNGGFKRQRNDICISQRKSSSQMIVRSYGTFPWGQCLEHNWSDISAIDGVDGAETVFSWTGYNITKNEKKKESESHYN